MYIDEKVLAHIKATVESGIMGNSSESQRVNWGLGEIESFTRNGFPGAKATVKTNENKVTIVFLYDYGWDLFDVYVCKDEGNPKLELVTHMVTTWGLPEAIDEAIHFLQK